MRSPCLCALLGSLVVAACGDGKPKKQLSGGDSVTGGDAVAGDAAIAGDTAGDPNGGDAAVGDMAGDVIPGLVASLYADDPVPNVGWIGGACAADPVCSYTDGYCLEEPEGYPAGMCTLDCDELCPDRTEVTDTTTFCVEGGATGMCAARCDFDMLTDGCRDGYACEAAFRHNDTGVVRSVCLPADVGYVPPAFCYAGLMAEGASLSGWDVQADTAAGSVCWVEGPTSLQSPVNGVSFRSFYTREIGPARTNCALAGALVEMTAWLAANDIAEVVHMGTYNCRVISGTTRLSQHAHANAIDIAELVRSDGKVFSVFEHWEHDIEPITEEGRFLADFAQAMFDAWVFNIILTPNYNSAHDDHFHVDLTSDSHTLLSDFPVRYIGPNIGH